MIETSANVAMVTGAVHELLAVFGSLVVLATFAVF